jgi:hypothetical protein
VAAVEVVDQPWVRGHPAEQFAGLGARGRRVGSEERAYPAEVLARLLDWDGGHGQVERAADRLGGGVKDGSRRADSVASAALATRGCAAASGFVWPRSSKPSPT